MRGLGKLAAGIFFIIIFLVTLFVLAIPLIWAGAIIVGILLIGYGVMDFIKGQKLYKCEICGFKAGSMEKLTQHAIEAHDVDYRGNEDEALQATLAGRRYGCTLCSFRAVSQKEVLEHVLETHEEELTKEEVESLRKAIDTATIST